MDFPPVATCLQDTRRTFQNVSQTEFDNGGSLYRVEFSTSDLRDNTVKSVINNAKFPDDEKQLFGPDAKTTKLGTSELQERQCLSHKRSLDKLAPHVTQPRCC